MENAHKFFASGKDLDAVETDLDIAQVRAGVRLLLGSGISKLSRRMVGQLRGGGDGWIDGQLHH